MRTLRRMLKLASLPPAVVLAATLVAAGCQSGATTSVATATAIPIATPTSTLATALSGTFSPTGSMTSPRLGHTATLLPSGKVLIAGGRIGDGTGSLASAELYDPASGTFRPTGSMSSTRAWHTATLLTNGKVLIAGGTTGLVLPGTPLASAELYDPTTGRFSPTGSMATARTAQTETRLKDGRVLIAGGCSDENRPVSSAELYDPGTGSFSSTGSMSTERCYSTATLLLSGKVLLTGGDDYWYGTSAELYDPATGTFSATGSMAFGRLGQAATLLPDGKVLVSGGNGQMNQAMEVYDPSAGRFSLAPFIPPVSVERSGDSATLLRSGKVLIAGGGTDHLTGGNVSTADLYDPATSAFSSTGAMSTIRSGASATLWQMAGSWSPGAYKSEATATGFRSRRRSCIRHNRRLALQLAPPSRDGPFLSDRVACHAHLARLARRDVATYSGQPIEGVAPARAELNATQSSGGCHDAVSARRPATHPGGPRARGAS